MKRQKQKSGLRRWHVSPRTKRITLISIGALFSLLILVNGILWLVYRERTYPRTTVMGTSIGSVHYGQLAKKVDEMKLLPTEITLTHKDQKTTINLSDFGVTKDVARSTASASDQRAWLPIINFFRSPELKAPVKIDAATFDTKSLELAKIVRADATSARLVLTGIAVTIQQESNGYELQKNQLQPALLKALDAGKKTLSASMKATSPKVKASDLKDAKQNLEAQLQTPITLRYNEKSTRLTAEDIAAWFVQSGEVYALDNGAIQAAVLAVGKEFSIRVKDVSGVAGKLKEAVTNQKAYETTLIAQTSAKTFSYCVATKGVSTSYVPAFKNMLTATLNHSRGWSINGLVEFRETTSGCDFTAWLSAAEHMPSFGAICDSMWSCRVGPNVVINFDRWQNASPAWNASGGSLDNYRHMVINHETGHWLSFGHSHCEGSGQPAPVMQQQSINLEGCTFNPWPTASELAKLRRVLGI